jgi:hypothetical protein
MNEKELAMGRAALIGQIVGALPNDQVYPTLCLSMTLLQAAHHAISAYLAAGDRSELTHAQGLIDTFLDDIPGQAAEATVAMEAEAEAPVKNTIGCREPRVVN